MTRDPSRPPYMPRLLGVGVSVLVVASLARLDVAIPGTPVPQSGQTLGVVCVGALMGARWGGVALLAYLLAGAVGLPVFADGGSGASTLMGPTAGYLWGFVLGAVLVGWVADSRGTSRPLLLFAAMCLAHVLILGLGWLRLRAGFSGPVAFAVGVEPFLVGGIVKSAVGAGIVWVNGRWLSDPS